MLPKSFNYFETSFSWYLSFDSSILSFSDSASLFDLSISSSLCWSFLSEPTSGAARKVGFLSHARRFFDPVYPTLCKAQIRSPFKYCDRMWSGASSTLPFIDRVQRRTIRIVDNSCLTSALRSLARRRAVASLPLFFYGHYFGCCISSWPQQSFLP